MPAATQWRRIRATFGWLTSTASAMRPSTQPVPSGPRSALSNTRAWVSLRAGAVPAAIRSWRYWRWGPVSTTGYFFFMPPSLPALAATLQISRH